MVARTAIEGAIVGENPVDGSDSIREPTLYLNRVLLVNASVFFVLRGFGFYKQYYKQWCIHTSFY